MPQFRLDTARTATHARGEVTAKNHAAFIWSVADLLRGDYKQSEYGKVILPLTVIRRLDCVLEPTKAGGARTLRQLKGRVENIEPVLEGVAGEQFYNTRPLDFTRLLDDPGQIAGNLRAYIAGFSQAPERSSTSSTSTSRSPTGPGQPALPGVGKFADIDLHPEVVSNIEMGYLYEELIRRFSELSNETAGEHFTPREVIRLMVNLLFIEDDDDPDQPGHRQDALRPGLRHGRDAVGRRGPPPLPQPDSPPGGLRPGTERRDLRRLPLRHDAEGPGRLPHRLRQLLHRGRPPGRTSTTCWPIRLSASSGRRSRTTSGPRHEKLGFRWPVRRRAAAHQRRQLPVPPAHDLEDEARRGGRQPGGHRLQRLAAVHRAAGSGESEIRRWIIENDWLEAVVALPDQLFYNTGISTYFWIVTNRKAPERRGKVQLVDAREYWVKMRK